MIRATDLRDYAIIPALERLTPYDKRINSPSAINLLLGTIAHESLAGRYLHQINGPAKGICQIEPDTHHDIYVNYINYRPELVSVMSEWRKGGDDQLIYDLRYSCMIARLIYWRVPDSLPAAGDVQGLSRYYKTHYNTNRGTASRAAWIDNYEMVADAAL